MFYVGILTESCNFDNKTYHLSNLYFISSSKYIVCFIWKYRYWLEIKFHYNLPTVIRLFTSSSFYSFAFWLHYWKPGHIYTRPWSNKVDICIKIISLLFLFFVLVTAVAVVFCWFISLFLFFFFFFFLFIFFLLKFRL